MPRDDISLDELAEKIGQEIGLSEWFAITQDMIDRFAGVTGDRQFIHVDPEAARHSPFGGTVAHGFLTAAMLSTLAADGVPKLQGKVMGINYGFDRLRFVSPVRAGGRIRGRFVLKSLNSKSPREHVITYAASVEQEGEAKPALVADWLIITHTA